MDFDDMELFWLRHKLYDMVKSICAEWGPEAKDFEVIKNDMLSYIAYKLWEKRNKPMNRDMDIWMDAEKTWNFLRYGWEY
jgi:hypothetical protein